jgi:hypothetical protein
MVTLLILLNDDLSRFVDSYSGYVSYHDELTDIVADPTDSRKPLFSKTVSNHSCKIHWIAKSNIGESAKSVHRRYQVHIVIL